MKNSTLWALLLSLSFGLTSCSVYDRVAVWYKYRNDFRAHPVGTDRLVAKHPAKAGAITPTTADTPAQASTAFSSTQTQPYLAPTEATAEAKALAAALTGGATSSPKKVALASAKPQKLGIRKLLKIRKALKEAAKAPQGGKSQLTALLLCFFLGLFAVHRFYLGYTTQGILQILTVLCCGLGIIWVLIDFVRIIAGDLQPADGMYEIEL